MNPLMALFAIAFGLVGLAFSASVIWGLFGVRSHFVQRTLAGLPRSTWFRQWGSANGG